MTSPLKLPGRKAEAARNDGVILAAAQRVFVRDPGAPITAVAVEAGVGISALYRRYPSKDELLRTLCATGLESFSAIAAESLAIDDPWAGLQHFITGVVEADVHSLTVKLAGTFQSTPLLRMLAASSGEIARQVFERAHLADVIRPDVVINDVVMVFEQLAAVRIGDEARTLQLRRRYLALQLDALRLATDRSALPESAPTDEELGRRWRHADDDPGAGR